MYNQSSSPDLISILTGILSLIMVITFFVMAFRLKKIMEYLKPMSGIALGEAVKKGMIEVTCGSCERLNYILDDQRPVYCTKCGKELKIKVPEQNQNDKPTEQSKVN
jgi:ribosomal protein S27E